MNLPGDSIIYLGYLWVFLVLSSSHLKQKQQQQKSLVPENIYYFPIILTECRVNSKELFYCVSIIKK